MEPKLFVLSTAGVESSTASQFYLPCVYPPTICDHLCCSITTQRPSLPRNERAARFMGLSGGDDSSTSNLRAKNSNQKGKYTRVVSHVKDDQSTAAKEVRRINPLDVCRSAIFTNGTSIR